MSDEKNVPFDPSPELLDLIETNRAGKFTRLQRTSLIIGALGSGAGVLCVGTFLFSLLANILLNAGGNIGLGNWLGLFFFVGFVLSFGFVGLSSYFNLSWFLPDVLSKSPIIAERGPLEIKVAAREREILPFSYIVGSYSFAPYLVPYEVPMETGREYIVYYAAKSRIFLSIEPVESHPSADDSA